jgi:hypothetical protein
MEPSCADRAPDRRDGFRADRRQEGMHMKLSVPDLFPRPEIVAAKIEADDGVISPAIPILAVDDFRLLRMQRELAR